MKTISQYVCIDFLWPESTSYCFQGPKCGHATTQEIYKVCNDQILSLFLNRDKNCCLFVSVSLDRFE